MYTIKTTTIKYVEIRNDIYIRTDTIERFDVVNRGENIWVIIFYGISGNSVPSRDFKSRDNAFEFIKDMFEEKSNV